MKRIVILTFLVKSFFCSCSISEYDVSGIYLKSPSLNTIDSLFLYTDSLYPSKVKDRSLYRYNQKFFNKQTGKLLFENSNKWWIGNNGKIEFIDLYLDTDSYHIDTVFSETRLKNATIPCSLPIKGNLLIVDIDKNVHYQKVKNESRK